MVPGTLLKLSGLRVSCPDSLSRVPGTTPCPFVITVDHDFSWFPAGLILLGEGEEEKRREREKAVPTEYHLGATSGAAQRS